MTGAETAQGWARATRGRELLVWSWRLLGSAQFALVLIGLLALAGLLAVVLPQIPGPLQGNPAAVDAWLAGQEGNFGPLTEPMHRLGLFTIVASWWFLTALGLLAASICVYAADRFWAIWRNVTRPRELVPDSFFDRAANRAALVAPGRGALADEIGALLARRRFSVRRASRGATTYLFADRFAWAQLGSFVTHLALVLFLVGALFSRFGGYTNALLIAEGSTSPVFPVSDPNQMQVEVVDAVARFDDEGRPLDYRSELVIYQGGREVQRGAATVNDPLEYDGYRFHQAGYLGEGAALRVRDVESGHTVYRETLALEELVPAPAVVVQGDGGEVLLDDVIVPTDFIEQSGGTLISVPETGKRFWAGLRQDNEEAWHLIVYEPDNEAGGAVIPEGGTGEAGGLSWSFEEATGLPSVVTAGVPGDSDRAMTVMAETPEGAPYVVLLGPVDGHALTLYPGEPVRIGDKEYVFEGRREFAGIEVRNDPGAPFIWIAAGLLLAGLLVTFYLPRLRLWVRVRRDEAVIAGPAERRGVFQSETERLQRELDATGTEEPGA